MGTFRGLNVRRLTQILQRQRNPSWGPDYKPSTLAVRGEAPSASHAHIIRCEKLSNRDLHLLSTPELHAALLGLYHPQTEGLQEQRMLSPTPKEHPLTNFPGCIAGGLPPLRGILAVAERLNRVSVLPRIRVDDPSGDGTKRQVIFPHIGDLLWAIRAPDGHVYCVNWSVKDSEEAFKRPFDERKIYTSKLQAPAEIQIRHELERVYYADAAIRTVHVAGSAINKDVASNLRQLFLHHNRTVHLTAQARADLVSQLTTCLDTGEPPSSLITRISSTGQISTEECRNVFYQAIWRRQLRVDLFSPVVINRPLIPETVDVLVKYADWFKELPC